MCRPAAELPADSVRPPPAAESDRTLVLQHGVGAVIEAMSGEVAFANSNEAAFAMLRRGCHHCAQLPEALDAMEPKDTVLAFLARVASRRTAVRQVKELGRILAQAEAWRSLLVDAPPPLRDVLLANSPRRASLAAEAAVVVNWRLLQTTDPAPVQDARVFLRERRSKRFLTVADVLAVECCIMTELPASLFVCHSAASTARLPEESSKQEVDPDVAEKEDTARSAGAEEAETTTLGFEHEGVPAPGRFLIGRRPWRRTSLRDALTGSGDWQLCCTSRDFGRHEEFLWGSDATLQHASSGFWLYVDLASPGEVQLQAEKRSAWEALPAT